MCDHGHATTDTTLPAAPADRARATAAAYDRRNKLFNRRRTGVLIAFALLWLVPVAWAIDTALKPNAETDQGPPTWAIENPTLDSFQTVLQQGDIWNWYLSSFITSAAIGRRDGAVRPAWPPTRCPGCASGAANWVFVFMLAGIMIPVQVLIVPLFREFDALHLLNTYWAVILPQVPAAIAVFIFKQFFDGLPARARGGRPRRRRELLRASTGRSSCRCRARPSPRWRSSRSSGRGTTCCCRCSC